MIGIVRLQVFNNILIGETSDSKSKMESHNHVEIYAFGLHETILEIPVRTNGRIGLKPSMIQLNSEPTVPVRAPFHESR
jgi:hypothetical protein